MVIDECSANGRVVRVHLLEHVVNFTLGVRALRRESSRDLSQQYQFALVTGRKTN